ncbi:MAG: M24 family metallopeptidase [Bryobacteraceae bacterium]
MTDSRPAADGCAARRRTASGQFGVKRHAKNPLDAFLVTHLPNVRYLTGFTGSNAMLLLLPSGESVMFTDPRYALQAPPEVSCPVRISRGPLLKDVAQRVTRLKLKRLGFERSRLTFDGHEFLRGALPARGELEPVSGLVEAMRMVKSEDEIACIRRSVQTNSRAFERVVRRIRPGKTRECELAAELEFEMRRLGAEKPAFETIVAAGERTAYPHARPSGRALGVNELLLIDMGATLDGYASDMTRMLSLGAAGSEAHHVYGAVAEAQLAAIDAVKPGVTGAHVDRAARRVLKGYGLDKAFVHSTGHGLGLEIHEGPSLRRNDKTRLEEGMAVTIEPGAYLEGKCGVRIEDTVVVRSGGCEVLTPTSKELLKI